LAYIFDEKIVQNGGHQQQMRESEIGTPPVQSVTKTK
jgi:hypothetical protein